MRRRTETSALLSDLQGAALEALREHHEAVLCWRTMWPALMSDPWRWCQKLLIESVDTARRAFALTEANAQALSQAVDRLQAPAEQAGQRVQETLSSGASRPRDTVRRAA